MEPIDVLGNTVLAPPPSPPQGVVQRRELFSDYFERVQKAPREMDAAVKVIETCVGEILGAKDHPATTFYDAADFLSVLIGYSNPDKDQILVDAAAMVFAKEALAIASTPQDRGSDIPAEESLADVAHYLFGAANIDPWHARTSAPSPELGQDLAMAHQVLIHHATKVNPVWTLSDVLTSLAYCDEKAIPHLSALAHDIVHRGYRSVGAEALVRAIRIERHQLVEPYNQSFMTSCKGLEDHIGGLEAKSRLGGTPKAPKPGLT